MRSGAKSDHTSLYHSIPKVEIFVLAVQLVIGDQRQRLVDLSPQQVPVPARLSPDYERPEDLLDCQHGLVALHWFLQRDWRFYLHAGAFDLLGGERGEALPRELVMDAAAVV